MKKNTLLTICIAIIGIFGCSTDEESILQLEKNNTLAYLKNNVNGVNTPEVVSDQIVIRFKNEQLTEEEKYIIRDSYKDKYQFTIEEIETCDCNNDGIELWTINAANPKGIIEDLVKNLKETDGEEDIEGDFQFSFQIINDTRIGEHTSSIIEKTVSENSEEAVKIAILDTGVDYDYFDNPFLYNSANTDGCDTEISGWDFVNHDNDPRDDNGHGTFITEIIRQELDKKDIAFEILPVKAFDNRGRGTYFRTACALNYISKKQDNFIVNTSFGFYGLTDQTILGNIITESQNKLLIVSSAGNEGVDTDSVGNEHFPSSYDAYNILTVGGYTGTLTFHPMYGNPYVSGLLKDPNSNYGYNSIDVVAPFDGFDLELVSNHSIINIRPRGTSYACAYATARAAQYYLSNSQPNVLKREVLNAGFSAYSLNGLIRNSKVLVRNFENAATYTPHTP